MKLTKQHKMFGLNAVDVSILSILAKEKHLPALEITNRSRNANATVAYRLHKLLERELVHKKRVKNHYEWALSGAGINVLSKPENFNSEIETFSDIKTIYKAFELLVKKGRTQKTYFLEGTNASQLAYSKLGPVYSKYLNLNSQKGKYLSEGISPQSIIEHFKTLPVDVLESHSQRTIAWWVVPDDLLQFPNTIIVQSPYTYIVNHTNESMIRIKDRAVAQTFISLIELTKNFGEKVDYNNVITEIIKETKSN